MPSMSLSRLNSSIMRVDGQGHCLLKNDKVCRQIDGLKRAKDDNQGCHDISQHLYYHQEKKFNWISIWYILNKIKCKQSIIQFQWKCLHNIVYSEYRLQKNGKIKWSMSFLQK
jgi:hypothetical protein